MNTNKTQVNFAERLSNIMKERNINDKELALKTGYTVTRIGNWKRGSNCPRVSELPNLANKLEVTIDWLLGGNSQSSKPSLPFVQIPQNQEEYYINRRKIIGNAKRILLLQARITPTLNSFTDLFHKFLMKGGVVRIIISDPNDECTMEMLARRAYIWANNVNRAKESINQTISNLNSLIVDHNFRQNQLSIKKMPYFPSTVLFIADPDEIDGQLLAATPICGQEHEFFPYITASKKEQPEVFNTYSQEFEALWKLSSKLSEAR